MICPSWIEFLHADELVGCYPRAFCLGNVHYPVSAVDDNADEAYFVTDSATLAELRAAASARREAEGRIETAAHATHRAGLSWGVIGAQLGMTRQGARQRFERLVHH